ncbi:MAG: segregation/condensation protein A [Deltaproteobacteria bacterium]|nr:segregation/condensation protein A [Deltaproteobacteria bacterium]
MPECDTYSEERSPYTIRLETFEGPLDLLLHLTQKNEMDIFNIPIALITEQYMEYLKWMKTLNLDIAGEYLLMASTLLHIKSKMLLPQTQEDEEEEGEDPRAELVRRLLEYQKYKSAASELINRPLLDRDVFVRLTSQRETQPAEEHIEATLFDLIDALRKALDRVKGESFHEVVLDRLTVEDKVQEILLLLQKENRSLPFHLLFPEQSSRRVIVITFLAILELVKTKWIRVFQTSPFETIRISPV